MVKGEQNISNSTEVKIYYEKQSRVMKVYQRVKKTRLAEFCFYFTTVYVYLHTFHRLLKNSSKF
jgi:hypothetical protein